MRAGAGSGFTYLSALVLVVAPLAGGPAAASRSGAGPRYEMRVTGAAEIGGTGALGGTSETYLVLGNGRAGPTGRDGAGAVYAVAAGSGRVDAREGSFEGFAVAGAAEGDALSSACVADVDGDGADDVVAGAEGADTANGVDSGAAYVVFGGAGDADVDLAHFDAGTQGDRGFRVDGATSSDGAGAAVACAGDVDGDGREDFVVAAPRGGASYVVFGKADTEPVDLMRFDLNVQGPAGFRINTHTVHRRGSYSVAGGGDTNGDGTPDVIVGVVKRPERWTGVVYVVFGKSDPAPVDTIGPDTTVADTWGYAIHGQGRGWRTGTAVASAGDANGDGRADVLIGANRRGSHDRAGRAYVVFGEAETDDVILGSLGDRGFTMTGGPGRDATGSSVAAAGDVNGDGLDDVVVGAPLARVRGRTAAGAVYLVYGSRGSRTVALRDMGRRGYAVLSGAAGAQAGGSVGAYGAGGATRIVASSYRRATTYVVETLGS